MPPCPVIKHYKGVCHIYVDETADLVMAAEVVTNSKVQRPGTCNALEKLLVRGVGCRTLPAHGAAENAAPSSSAATSACAPSSRDTKLATEEEWYEEYLDLILTVKVVKGLDEAAAHIEKYGSSHTDGICSSDCAAHRASS